MNLARSLHTTAKALPALLLGLSAIPSLPAQLEVGKAGQVPSAAGLELLWVKPGTFTMGSPLGEAGRNPDETQHQQTLTQGYWLGKYEVTQAQWAAVMGSAPSRFTGDNLPVEQVSWEDAAAFCAAVNTLEKKARRLPTGYTYQLPSEAQWEYACRAGATGSHAGQPAGDYGWYWNNSTGRTQEVGLKQRNRFGFHDMHGNVQEWCLDWYAPYRGENLTDSSGPSNGSAKVLRGGNWHQYPNYARSADRRRALPTANRDSAGFRLCLSPALQSSSPGPITVLPGLQMIWVEPGTFTMGSPTSEPDRSSDETQHQVTLTKGYWLAKHELTQAQWKAVMGPFPFYFKGDNLPVESVSWEEAKAFCDKLQEQESAAGRVPAGYAYQLPTEAQWEYACRAGTTTATAFGNSLSSTQARFNGASPYNGGAKGPYRFGTANVGSYAANAWGFHDMHGNVWEWCADWYGSYPTGSVTDPAGAGSGADRVFRGGSWDRRRRVLPFRRPPQAHPGVQGLFYLGFRPSLRSE